MPTGITLWFRIVVSLSGLWLLFRQGFEPYLLNWLPIGIVDSIAIGVTVSFLLWNLHSLGPNARRRIAFALAILLSGIFVLRLAPQEALSERVLWASSLKLFGSRALPFLGLLAVVLAWRRKSDTTVIVTPFRRWMKLSRPVYTTIGAMLAFLFSWFMAQFGYGGLPVVDDGVAHLFQARIFATGHLALPPPPHPEAFRFFGIIQDPGWLAMFPPGYPVLLAVAVLVGGISLVNPLLTALAVPAIELIAYRAVGRKAAAITVLLFAFSPFVPVIGGSFRSHSLTLLLVACSTGLLLDPQQKRWSILFSGGFAGLAFLARPYTAFLWCVGLVLGVAACRRRGLWRTVALFGLSTLPGISLAILYNLVQTGGAIIPAPIFLYGERFTLGFGPRAMGDHTVLRAISYTTTRIEALGRLVMGWPFPLLLLPFAVLALPGHPLRSGRTRLILLFPVVAVLLGYACYWCLEFTHGPRFTYCILATTLPLCAESLLALQKRLSTLLHADRDRRAARFLSLGLLLSIIYAGVVSWPETVRVFGSYGSSRPDLSEHVKVLPPGKKLIFFVPTSPKNPGYGAGFLLNDLDLSGDLVVALDHGETENREVMDFFPERTVYRYRFDPTRREGSLELYEIQKAEPEARHPSTP